MNQGLVAHYKKPPKRNIEWVVLIITAIIAIAVVLHQAYAQSVVKGKVVQVKDGDTVVIAPIEGGQFFTCRLSGIDAPETARRNRQGQPHGNEATKELKRLVLGQTVDAQLTGRRTHNREVCIIKKNGQDVNLEMIRSGHAWAYRQFLKRPHASEYIAAEEEARNRRLGLWQQSNPTPPWEFRRSQR